MIRALLLFIAMAIAWAATLWFGIKPDFSQWSQARVLALNAGPPLAVAAVWGTWRLIHWASARRATLAAAEKEASGEAQRQAAQAEARRRHAAELQHRQQACDCRGVAMMQVAQPENAEPAFGLMRKVVGFSSFDGGEEDITILAHLRTGIVEAMENLYGRVKGAAVFPIYVMPPADAAAAEVFACVQEARAQVLDALGLERRPDADFNRILFLPGANTAADSVLGLFDSTPDLPGAVVLAFDSTWLRKQRNSALNSNPGDEERRHRMGQPSQGVFALLLTCPDFESRLDAAKQPVTEVDAMTPYWERDLAPAGRDNLLGALTREEKDSLRLAPILARVHRAAFVRFPAAQQSTMDMARDLQGLLEHAQVNAALVESPFDTADAAASGEDFPVPHCAWLVHNAGGVDHSGLRLAALGTALHGRGLPTDPIDAATNVVVQGGDFGQAHGVALLALTLARAAEHEAAALCAEFAGSDSVGMYFATPPRLPA